MPYKVAIANGKGGAGKTTVSVNFLMQLIENLRGKIQLVDCDVEEPRGFCCIRAVSGFVE